MSLVILSLKAREASTLGHLVILARKLSRVLHFRKLSRVLHFVSHYSMIGNTISCDALSGFEKALHIVGTFLSLYKARKLPLRHGKCRKIRENTHTHTQKKNEQK